MSFQTRSGLYKQWESFRSRPLVSYVTSIRSGTSGVMASDAVPFIIDQINKIPPNERKIDFLIVSNGGDPITAQRIMSILRERFDEVSVVVPYVAFSAATILAFGADEIIMHPYSNLGPVDPQITVPNNQNIQGQPSQLNFSSEDIRNYIEFIKTDVGITDQQHLATAFNALATEVGALSVGFSKRNQQLSLTLSEKMLETHMADKNKAATIAHALNSDYYHHGYAVGRKEAKELGLSIVDPSAEQEAVMWAIWEDFCEEMQCNRPFDPMAELFAHPEAREQVANMPVVDLPANMPPELVSQIFASLANNVSITQRMPIELRVPVAAIESTKVAYSVDTNVDLLYYRDQSMQVKVNATAYSNGWEQTRGLGGEGDNEPNSNNHQCELSGPVQN